MLKIRMAELADLPKIIELIKKDKEPLNEDLGAIFNFEGPNEKCRFFVAEGNGEIVGFGSAFLQVEQKRLCDKPSRRH